jgi:hypothetical protein
MPEIITTRMAITIITAVMYGNTHNPGMALGDIYPGTTIHGKFATEGMIMEIAGMVMAIGITTGDRVF